MAQTANTFGTPNNTVGNLNGLFKESYADKLNELIPDGVKLMNKIKFMSKDEQFVPSISNNRVNFGLYRKTPEMVIPR